MPESSAMTRLSAEEVVLLNEIAAGSGGDCEALIRCEAKLLGMALKMGAPRQDCSDIVQEVFIAAIHGIRAGRFRCESSLMTWLDAIMKHKVKDLWRSLVRQRDLFLPIDSIKRMNGAPKEYSAWAATVWDLHIDAQAVLNRMSAEHRRVFLLNRAEGLTVYEISRMLKKPAGTIGRQLAEADRIFRNGGIVCAITAITGDS